MQNFKRNYVLGLTLFFWGFSLQPVLVEEKSATKVKTVMLDLTTAFRSLEVALSEGNAQQIRQNSELLRGTAEEIPDLGQWHNNMAEHFRTASRRIKTLATEMAGYAKANKIRLASQVLADIRKECVGCHVRAEGLEVDKNSYPVKGNTLSGRLKIYKMDGQERGDKSNVVVFLDGVKSDKPFPSPRKPVRISQKDRNFSPRVLPVMKGTRVFFPNDDTIFHNAFSLSRPAPFDLDVYPPGKSKSVVFDKTGLVKVYCNIHPKMIANILVLANPFFTLSDENGYFILSEIPDGNYTLRTWHEFGPETKRNIKLVDGNLVQVDIAIRENKKFVQHTNKFGKRYKDKY